MTTILWSALLLSFLFVLCPEHELLLLSQGGLQPPHEEPSQGSRPGQVSRGGGCVIHFVCWLFFVIELGRRDFPLSQYLLGHIIWFSLLSSYCIFFILGNILSSLYIYTRLSTFSFSLFLYFSPQWVSVNSPFLPPAGRGGGRGLI